MSTSTIVPYDPPEIEDVLGLPFEIDGDYLYGFDQIEITEETTCGNFLRVADDDAREILENNFITTAMINDESSTFRITALSEEGDDTTLLPPLAWLNRIVKVTLPSGAVVGTFNDETLRDCQHLYVEALPGKPMVPPLPIHLVKGISLVPKVFHYSFERDIDASCGVRKYLHQRCSYFYSRELHTECGFSEIWHKVFHHMLYEHKVDDSGRISAKFLRFPPPSQHQSDAAEHQDEAAEHNDWRLRWATQPTHGINLGSQESYVHNFNEKENDETVVALLGRAIS